MDGALPETYSICMSHHELHRSDRISWLRAAVLGANDGIVSISSLIVGVAAAHGSNKEILISSVAALVAGAMSMAAGEYVSVSSQADTEKADLAREKDELANNLDHEQDELTQIYMDRGLDENLAREVALKLMKHDALGSHARDELGISVHYSARPMQAAFTSALMFASGAIVPILAFYLFQSSTQLIPIVWGVSILSLAGLGIFSARIGGANIFRGVTRVVIWGVFAMIVTSFIGKLF